MDSAQTCHNGWAQSVILHSRPTGHLSYNTRMPLDWNSTLSESGGYYLCSDVLAWTMPSRLKPYTWTIYLCILRGISNNPYWDSIMTISQNDIECFTRWTNLVSLEFASSTDLRLRNVPLVVLRLPLHNGASLNQFIIFYSGRLLAACKWWWN